MGMLRVITVGIRKIGLRSVSLNPLEQLRRDGKITTWATGLSLFSNIARGAELFTVSAPGGYISAADAVTNGYTIKSGTSMATPQVSGAAALVAQAFPWMNGKQLADVILTTANSNIECPDILVGFVGQLIRLWFSIIFLPKNLLKSK